MNSRQVRSEYPDVHAHVAGAFTTSRIAAILGRGTEHRRPAILLVLHGGGPVAGVFDELELLGVFPDAPIVHLEPLDRLVPGVLLVFVADESGATAYAIVDPRGLN